MNRLTILYTLLLLVSVTFSSCYNDLNLDKYRPDPIAVLNSAISPDTVVMASVSHTVFFADYRDVDPTIRDADVDLYVNDKFQEKMVWTVDTLLKAGGIYRSTYQPATGDKIKIEAHTSFGDASGEDIVPESTAITDVKLSYIQFEDQNSTVHGPGGVSHPIKYKITYDITFKDDPDKRNYYCIRLETLSGYSLYGIIDYSEDAVFVAQRPIIDSSAPDKTIFGRYGLTFTDDIINGKQYTMRITETEDSDNIHHGKHNYRRIVLYSLSEAYYKYLTGILNKNNTSITGTLIDFGFSEPLPHYSNISGGLGMLATLQSNIYTLDLRTIFPDYWGG